MATTEEKEIILKNGRFIHRTHTDRDLGSQEGVLRELMQEMKTSIPDQFQVETVLPSTVADAAPSKWETPAHCLVAKNTITYGMEVPFYPIKMPFFENSSDCLAPMTSRHYEDEYDIDGDYRMPWKLLPRDSETEIRHWFLCEFSKTDEKEDRYFFMVTMKNGSRVKAFIPNVPNVYDEGVICTGNFPKNEKSHQDKIQQALDIFMIGACNIDLSFSWKCCMFDRSGELQMPINTSGPAWSNYYQNGDAWHALNSHVTTDFYEEIILAHLYTGSTNVGMSEV